MQTYSALSFMSLCALSATVIASDCIPTPHRTTGTHYAPVTVQKVDVSQGVTVRGRILAAPDCIPITNAKISHWQANVNGQYVDRLRAYLFSSNDGGYEFETEWPNLSPPHIHFIVSAEGYEDLETQWRGWQKTNLIEFNIILKKVNQ